MLIRFRTMVGLAAATTLMVVLPSAYAAPIKNIERRTSASAALHGLRSVFAPLSKFDSPDRSSVVRTALSYRGARYRYGGSGRSGFDCSGFTRYVYGKDGTGLPRTAASQFRTGKKVSLSQLQPGDLLFFRSSRKSVGHVAMYIGAGKMVHAANPRKGVTTDSISMPYYRSRFVGARRPVK